MKDKYFLRKLVALIAIIMATALHMASGQNTYYYGLGVQPLTIVDSIITIKFDAGYPQQDYGTFANEFDALDENVEPRPTFIGFEVYHVEPGHDVESLLLVIRQEPQVTFAYPAYKDTSGCVYKLNDRILIQYNDSVTVSQMDSIFSCLADVRICW